ncbi:MAG: three-Cys-motif partner protein TcmP [Candidatus Bathyarchaeia archaeon]
MYDPSLIVELRDGLPCLDIPSYTLKRYILYRIIFAEWTKWIAPKTEWIGYLDLTAGPGYSIVREYKDNYQVAASPVIALKTEPKFTNLIFIEREKNFYDALEKRVKTRFAEREKNCRFLLGDANVYVRSAIKMLEGHCLVCVDPFRPTDISWKTLEKILEEDFCDLIGAYPAPLVQRSIGRHSGRYFVPGVHRHMPPGFLLNIKKRIFQKSAEFCRKVIKQNFGRFSIHCFVKELPYPILFCTKDFNLANHLYDKLEAEKRHDQIIYEK